MVVARQWLPAFPHGALCFSLAVAGCIGVARMVQPAFAQTSPDLPTIPVYQVDPAWPTLKE